MGWEPGPDCSGERNAVLPNLHEGCPSEKGALQIYSFFYICELIFTRMRRI